MKKRAVMLFLTVLLSCRGSDEPEAPETPNTVATPPVPTGAIQRASAAVDAANTRTEAVDSIAAGVR